MNLVATLEHVLKFGLAQRCRGFWKSVVAGWIQSRTSHVRLWPGTRNNDIFGGFSMFCCMFQRCLRVWMSAVFGWFIASLRTFESGSASLIMIRLLVFLCVFVGFSEVGGSERQLYPAGFRASPRTFESGLASLIMILLFAFSCVFVDFSDVGGCER